MTPEALAVKAPPLALPVQSKPAKTKLPVEFSKVRSPEPAEETVRGVLALVVSAEIKITVVSVLAVNLIVPFVSLSIVSPF